MALQLGRPPWEVRRLTHARSGVHWSASARGLDLTALGSRFNLVPVSGEYRCRRASQRRRQLSQSVADQQVPSWDPIGLYACQRRAAVGPYWSVWSTAAPEANAYQRASLKAGGTCF
jgi:hypothetical protein